MTNEIFIKNLKNKFSNLNGLTFQENYLIYNDEKIDLKNIHLETFFRQNTNLMKDLDILDSLTVFKIIFYHCNYNMEKEIFLNIDENIVIKALRVVNHKNSDGLINNYIYLINEKDNDIKIESASKIIYFNSKSLIVCINRLKLRFLNTRYKNSNVIKRRIIFFMWSFISYFLILFK